MMPGPLEAPAGSRPPARIAVGSRNPVKVEAVREVASALLPGAEVRGVEVESGVAEQPRSDEETLRGAEARARAALASGATFGVGIESGVAPLDGRLYGFTWVAVRSADGRSGTGCSARFALPPSVAADVESGLALEEAMHRATGRSGLGRAEGAMGVVTAGRVTRQSALHQALLFAFAPWTRADLYDHG